MKKVVYILGVNRTGFILQDLLDDDKAIFKGYVSLNKVSGNQAVRGGYPLISMDKLQEEQYDYLLICDYVDYDKADSRNISVLNCLSLISMQLSSEFYAIRKKAVCDMNDENVCGIVTGMSYLQRGLIPELLHRKFCMCACPCQDLYYDLYTLADAAERMGKRLQYSVMGVSPYSFRYDLSLSKENSSRVIYYFREFGEVHHLVGAEESIEEMRRQDDALNEICYPIWQNILYDNFFDEPFARVENTFCFETGDEEQQMKSLEIMKKIGNKPYPETVRENILLFEMYLKLCAERSIKVLVLIPPFSKFFREHFPAEYVEEARTIIENYHEKYDLKVLDLYDSPEFMDDDYYADEDHLNVYGAEKLTEMLNSVLEDGFY